MALHSGWVPGPLFFQVPEADVGHDRSGGCQPNLGSQRDEGPTPPLPPNRKRKRDRREERENRKAGVRDNHTAGVIEITDSVS